MSRRGKPSDEDDSPRRSHGVMTASGRPDGSWQLDWVDDDRSFHFTASRDDVACWMRAQAADQVVVMDPARGQLTLAEWLEVLRQERALTARPAEEVEDKLPVDQWMESASGPPSQSAPAAGAATHSSAAQQG